MLYQILFVDETGKDSKNPLKQKMQFFLLTGTGKDSNRGFILTGGGGVGAFDCCLAPLQTSDWILAVFFMHERLLIKHTVLGLCNVKNADSVSLRLSTLYRMLVFRVRFG